MIAVLSVLLSLFSSFIMPQAVPAVPEYTIQAIRFGTLPNVKITTLMPLAKNPSESFDIGVVVWLIRGGGKNILFDTGYHRQTPGFDQWHTQDFVPPA